MKSIRNALLFFLVSTVATIFCGLIALNGFENGRCLLAVLIFLVFCLLWRDFIFGERYLFIDFKRSAGKWERKLLFIFGQNAGDEEFENQEVKDLGDLLGSYVYIKSFIFFGALTAGYLYLHVKKGLEIPEGITYVLIIGLMFAVASHANHLLLALFASVLMVMTGVWHGPIHIAGLVLFVIMFSVSLMAFRRLETSSSTVNPTNRALQPLVLSSLRNAGLLLLLLLVFDKILPDSFNSPDEFDSVPRPNIPIDLHNRYTDGAIHKLAETMTSTNYGRNALNSAAEAMRARGGGGNGGGSASAGSGSANNQTSNKSETSKTASHQPAQQPSQSGAQGQLPSSEQGQLPASAQAEGSSGKDEVAESGGGSGGSRGQDAELKEPSPGSRTGFPPAPEKPPDRDSAQANSGAQAKTADSSAKHEEATSSAGSSTKNESATSSSNRSASNGASSAASPQGAATGAANGPPNASSPNTSSPNDKSAAADAQPEFSPKRAEEQTHELENKLNAWLDKFALVLKVLVGFVVIYLIFSFVDKLKRTKEVAEAKSIRLSHEDRQLLRERLRSIRARKLKPAEEIIETYQALLKVFEAVHIVREPETPVSVFSKLIAITLPYIGLPMREVTTCFEVTLYGEKQVARERIESFRGSVQKILQYFNL